MASIFCPYCLEKIQVGEIARRCNICRNSYAPNTKDGLLLMLGRVIRCKTRGCNGQYSLLECPRCGHELPPDIAQYDRYVRFSVVAPSGAGKSNFITAMLEEVGKCKALNYLVGPMNRETQDIHRANRDMMYDLMQPVPATDRGVVTPMQWRFQDLGRATNKTVPPYSVTIFDGAGEDQTALDPTICRYIAGSRMIMLLLDPTKLHGVRARMTPEEITCSGGTAGNITMEETQDFINGLINYLKTACGVRAEKKLQIPVAVVFSKIDAVARHLGNAVVLQPSGHARKGAFSVSEAQAVHEEIDGWMDLCGDDLTRLFHANFEQWKYFGVSSYGALPRDRRQLSQAPRPLRVLDPLIWDFVLEGILRSCD